MNKVKEIFSSDKPSTHHNSTTSGSSGNAGSATTGSAATGSATSGSASSIPNQHVEEVAPAPSSGHVHPQRDTHLAQQDAHAADHDHKHLAAVTHHTHQKHEVEEVERERHVDRHLHHVQHHVQPVVDSKHESERHRENVVPTTKIHEKHVNTDADATQFAALNKHQDQYKEAAIDRVVVDRGEKVNEETHHHVHHVIQPVIERDTHEHHVIHTKVPIHHETHEAPIVHQSVEHQPMKLSDFVAGGGDIKSKLTHENAGVLHTQDESCKRTTDGPLESLKDKLHLGSTKHDAPPTNVVQ
ncbi:BZ3500_MvSof-1268-A1-R1_Chr3-1g05456 [Microbotryum saponariae]|uniref:BZ3500_MvSof-1268-A1-R1_Chr3-1g05456 protein n=1 Tax=Microbotryum saponariae TaxID=289078 RepID=A0A2X0NHL6_9BASI|nr:BZ3500_MvSof-1268-A1-R1_Chr3-1g05456 [Microbotryum saponariae]SDA04647.1 BZ3501_MvSof-1269-A2-R1_Chr3-1g05127 [Microbotryum saponariae]